MRVFCALTLLYFTLSRSQFILRPSLFILFPKVLQPVVLCVVSLLQEFIVDMSALLRTSLEPVAG